jgi:hypothetical protein
MFGMSAFGTRPFCGSARDMLVLLLATGTVNADFAFVLYSATTEFATKPTDALRSQPFAGTLQQPLNFKRSLLGGSDIGVFTTGDGEMDVDNADGTYDFLIEGYAIDGRDIVVKCGRLGDDYADFFPVFVGTAADWAIDESIIKVVLRDNGYKLTVPAQPNVYGGTGAQDGGADLAGKRKPRAFGHVLNVSPPLVVPASLIYQVNDGPVSGVAAVYDRGSALGAGADHADYAALAAATVAAGFYDTCLAQGYVKLGSSPVGTVTADVDGDATGGVFVATSGTIVRRLVGTSTVIVDPDDLYLPSFAALEVTQPAPIGYWLGSDDTSSVADVVANIMGGVGGWAGFRRDGRLEANVFVAPAGVPVDRFDRIDDIDIKREPLPSDLTPPPWRQRVAYQRSWTVQTDLAGAVSADRKAFVSESFRLSEASSDAIRGDHPFAQDPDPIEAYFANEADAQAEAARRLVLYGSARALYRATLPPRALQHNLGETIVITYPRWDLSTGRLLTIVEMTDDGKSNTVEVVAYG